jgi:hypothetical protein
MIEKRLPDFQRMRHAGAVDLGQDISDQVGLHIEILDERKRLPPRCFAGMSAQHLDGAVSLQVTPERVAREPVPHGIAHDGDAVEVSLHRVAGQRFQRGLGAQYLRRPVRFRIQVAEQPEDRCP